MATNVAAEPTWQGNHMIAPPFGVFYRFTSAAGLYAEFAFEELREADEFVYEQEAYDDQPITTLVIRAGEPA